MVFLGVDSCLFPLSYRLETSEENVTKLQHHVLSCLILPYLECNIFLVSDGPIFYMSGCCFFNAYMLLL